MDRPLYQIMTGAIMPEDPSEYPNRMGSLNKKLESLGAPGRVHELYSSLRGSYSKLPTARPDFRLAHHNWEYLKQYVDACHANGLIFNYTMNSNMRNMMKLYLVLKNLQQVQILLKLRRVLMLL